VLVSSLDFVKDAANGVILFAITLHQMIVPTRNCHCFWRATLRSHAHESLCAGSADYTHCARHGR